MSTFSTIYTNLNTVLQALVTDDKLSCCVFGRRWDFTGYPAARFYLEGVDNQLLAAGGGAGATYRRAWRFRIDVVQEISEKSASQGETDLCTAVDNLLAELEEEWTLGGSSDVIDAPSSAGAQDIQTANGRLIIVPVIVTPRTLLTYS